MAEVQSVDVPLEFSSDAGTTWKKLVCRVSNSFKSDFSITEEETDCGTYVGTGPIKWGFDFAAVVNTTPTTASEVSYKDFQSWHNNKTKVQVRQQAGASGADFYHSGECYIPSLSLDFATSAIVKFSGSVKGNGALDIAP